MKKVALNCLKIALIVAIIIISIIATNRITIKKVEEGKEQLTSSGNDYIKTSEHLAQIEQASQIEPMSVNMSISKGNNGLSTYTSIDISKYTKCTINSVSSSFGLITFYKADGTQVNMSNLTNGQVIDVTEYTTFQNAFYNGWYTNPMSMTCKLLFE